VTGILDNPAFESAIADISRRSGKPGTGLMAEAAADLKEMSSSKNFLAVRMFAALGRFIYRRGYHRHPVFDLDEVERVRAASSARSVVFLVTHKTYLDFFVLFDFLYRQGIPTPYIFGGLNMNFAGFGVLARHAGGIFIRRSFKDDEVYKLVLKRYIESLIQDGSCFMWAIEGTRSRTGKLLMPKLGLLNYVSDASRNLASDAISYIPVSVVYDQIPDVVDMAAQEAGAEKKPENLAWFMNYVRGIGGPFGNIHIRFGEAMAMTETPDAPDLNSSRALVSEEQIEIQKLAFEACYRINEITPATMTSLVMMVLLCRGPCDLARIRQDVKVLNEDIRLQSKRAMPSRPSRDLSEDPAPTIEALIATGVLRGIGDGSQRTFEIAADRISVAIYYSNMAVHHFVIGAFVELALIALTANAAIPADADSLWAECQRLRNLFKFEFFFSRTRAFQQQLRTELNALSSDWRSILGQGGESVRSMLGGKPILVAAGVLSPFVAAYRLVGEMLDQDAASRRLTDQDFVQQCLGAHIGAGGNSSGSQSVPGVSRALLLNGLRVADSRGLRDDSNPSAAADRAAFLAELEKTASALEAIGRLA
jgi:glycerol-3-phosphate O-acyltransferase